MPFFLVLLIIIFSSCQQQEEVSVVVARVGSASLTEKELMASSTLSSEGRSSFIENWVKTELLYQAGNNVGLDKDLMLDKKIIQYRKKLVGQAFLDTRILSAVYVSKEEVRNYYLKNKEAFKRLKSEATINSFLISDKKEASRIRANLEKSSNNKKRREMFDKHSVVAETIKDGMLNPKINKRVFSPKKDKYIGPVDLGDVFAVIEVVKRYEKGTYLGLDSVYDTIYLLIYKRKTAIKTQNIIDSLKQEFILETNTNTL